MRISPHLLNLLFLLQCRITPLHIAVLEGKKELVAFLLMTGADGTYDSAQQMSQSTYPHINPTRTHLQKYVKTRLEKAHVFIACIKTFTYPNVYIHERVRCRTTLAYTLTQ